MLVAELQARQCNIGLEPGIALAAGIAGILAFETRAARVLRDLFIIVGGRPGTEVLVDGKRVPYASELWLPLFWPL